MIPETPNRYYASIWVEMRWESFEHLFPFLQEAYRQAGADDTHIEMSNLMNLVRSTLQRRPEPVEDLLAGLL